MNTYMTSSTESRIIESICHDICDRELSIYYLTAMVRYDKTKKRICFLSLKELWETGLVIKKYIEYPYTTAGQIENSFAEIDCYLKKGGYIVHFLSENIVSEDVIYIVNILKNERKLQFVSKDFSGNIEEETVSFEEYCKRFLPLEGTKQKMRFDVYRLVEESGFHKRQVKGKQIGIMDEILCLLQPPNIVADSGQILREWYQLLTEVLEQSPKLAVSDDNEIINSKVQELFLNKTNVNRRKYVHYLIKSYNGIVQRIGQLPLGEENE